MPEFSVKVDRKYMQRYAEGYLGDKLLADRGDHLQELACEQQFPVTHQQLAVLDRMILQDGITLVIAEDGTIRLN